MRRHALALLAVLGLVSSSRADDDLNVPTPWSDGVARGKPLYAFLESLAKTHFDARRAAVAALKTPDEIARRRATLRVAFREALGELPAEETPLNARVVGMATYEGYSVEGVVYESRPGHHVAANLYLPKGDPPFPGVLVPCGHADNGKAFPEYQSFCALLARNGLAALCYDPIGQGERKQWIDDAGKPVIGGSTNEHTLIGIGALLVGRSAAGYRFWDGVRSLDYLASRPEIDPARLGCSGNSGGGTETAYLMALDDRILAAAPSCYITSLERLFATLGPQDAEQDITGQVALGIEHADYVTMRAPKPTLISAGTRDFFDIQGTWDTFREVKRIYCALGQGEHVDLFESDEKHGLTRPRRESAARWLRRCLKGIDDRPLKPEAPVVPDKDLQCTRTGQVLASIDGEKSVFDLNADRAAELDRMRAERFAHRTVEELRAEVRKRIALAKGPESVAVRHLPRVERSGYAVDLLAIETEPGLVIPVLLFRRDEPGDKPLVVYLGADRALAAAGGEIERRVKTGEPVALIEPRGMGESAPRPQRPGLFGPDEREAFLSLHLDRPLLGQRVGDVLAAVTALMPSKGRPEYHLIGIGDGGPIAWHVAALDPRVLSLTVERSFPSWSSTVRSPSTRGNLAAVVPNALLSYDLPELAPAIVPRPLTVRDPVDPAGKSVPQSALAAALAATRAAYRTAGAEDALTLQAGPQ